MNPKAVLAYCREKGIRSFDLRYTDLIGESHQVTFPVGSLSEGVFENGVGQECVLDPLASTHPYAILLPDSNANYLDPFTEQPNLVLISSVQDVVRRQDSLLDSRWVASQSLRYLQSTAIADDVRVRTAIRFHASEAIELRSGRVELPRGMDDQYLVRCKVVDRAVDAGLSIDRHLRGADGSSEIVLKSASVQEACDDAMMLRYVIAHVLQEHGTVGGFQSCWTSSQWSFVRDQSPLFSDGTYHGLSEIGLYAQGGLLKHSRVLSGIYLLAQSTQLSVYYPFKCVGEPDNPLSICREIRDAMAPREIVLELRALPSIANYYLAYAATLMAMADGVQAKLLPANGEQSRGAESLSDDLHVWRREACVGAVESEWEFLRRGDVFSEALLNWIQARVRGDS